MKLSLEEEWQFRTADKCYLSDNRLGADRVRDHCHLIGKFRRAAHNECNLALKFQANKRNKDDKRKHRFFIPFVS